MNTALSFLTKHFANEITHFNEIGKGFFSKAFSFHHNGQHKILRISNSDLDFKKDQLISKRLKSIDAPIPKILEIGPFEDKQYFCISERAPGKTFNKLTLQEKKDCIPALFKTLKAIHQLDLSHTKGFGLIDINGNGQFDSWADLLLCLENHKIPYDFEEIFAVPYFDKVFFYQQYDSLKDLTEIIPKKCFFVHGDFGFDNLLINNGKITGVIDWGEARIGDPSYDVAWLDFWSDDISFAELILAQARNHGKKPEGIEERILACSLHIGLHSMLFATHLKNKNDYQDAVKRIDRAIKRFKP